MKDKMVIIQKGREIRALLFHLGGRHMGAMETVREEKRKLSQRKEGLREMEGEKEQGEMCDRDNWKE